MREPLRAMRRMNDHRLRLGVQVGPSWEAYPPSEFPTAPGRDPSLGESNRRVLNVHLAEALPLASQFDRQRRVTGPSPVIFRRYLWHTHQQAQK